MYACMYKTVNNLEIIATTCRSTGYRDICIVRICIVRSSCRENSTCSTRCRRKITKGALLHKRILINNHTYTVENSYPFIHRHRKQILVGGLNYYAILLLA